VEGTESPSSCTAEAPGTVFTTDPCWIMAITYTVLEAVLGSWRSWELSWLTATIACFCLQVLWIKAMQSRVKKVTSASRTCCHGKMLEKKNKL